MIFALTYCMLIVSTLPTDSTPEAEPLTDEVAQDVVRPHYASFKASDVTMAINRTAEVASAHPSYPQARVRRTVAREMGISTVQLRYLLRKAAELAPQRNAA